MSCLWKTFLHINSLSICLPFFSLSKNVCFIMLLRWEQKLKGHITFQLSIPPLRETTSASSGWYFQHPTNSGCAMWNSSHCSAHSGHWNWVRVSCPCCRAGRHHLPLPTLPHPAQGGCSVLWALIPAETTPKTSPAFPDLQRHDNNKHLRPPKEIGQALWKQGWHRHLCHPWSIRQKYSEASSDSHYSPKPNKMKTCQRTG